MTEFHCKQAVLKQLLSDSLPDSEESAVSEHLSACSECRREFEVMAASNEWWAEASQRLSSQVDRNDEHFDDRDASHFTSDFAVDFLEPSDDVQALGRLGEYDIIEVIGRGGMGVVLKGFQKELYRHVAVKVLLPHLASSGAARRRFAREAQATAAVVHPHVMAIHSVNASAKLPYLVMPFVACQSLQQRIHRNGPLELKDVLRIGMQTALGLAAAHAQGLVHRDVKPANILLESNVDRVLLTDFGLARAVDDATLTRTGIIAGTPQYMSPEQANGDEIDHRSDLFSLGGALYAACTGRPPFRAETTFGVLRRIRETPPRPIREINPDIPEWFERIVLKLLAKDVNRRFQSANEVAQLLEQCLAHVQQPTSVPLPPLVARGGAIGASNVGSRRLPNPAVWLTACAIFVVSLITGIIAWNLRPVADMGQSKVNITSPTSADEQPVRVPPLTDSEMDWNSVTRTLDATEAMLDALEKSIRNE